MPRSNTEHEIKKALSNSRVFIVKRKNTEGQVQRWPFVASTKDKVFNYLAKEDPDGVHEIEDVYAAPTLIV